MLKPKELNVPNRITAAEAKKLAPDYDVVEKFLRAVYGGIRNAVATNKTTFTYTIWNEALGDVKVLYNNRNATKQQVLTITGLECVGLLEKDGFKVDLSLYYEEKQFVDMQLNFIISW